MSSVPRRIQEVSFAAAAQDYLRRLPLEHHMEATPQATQRKITLSSLELLHARRPDVQVFNELLVQWRRKHGRFGRVVPDNMVVLHPESIQAEGSFDLPLQPVRPFWVLEYVSKSNARKDYDASFKKYEQTLKVPYFLLFYPDTQDLTLYRHNGEKYVSVPPNAHDRHALPELELEVGLLDGWVRYWHRGELLPLPADLLRDLERTQQQLAEERQRATAAEQRAEAAERQAQEQQQKLLALQAELARLKGGQSGA